MMDMKDTTCISVLTLVRIILVFQIITLSAKSFDFKCPVHAHWKNWANEKCNSTLKYFCLHNDVERKYVEGCTGPDWDRSGSKRVYAGDFTRGDCIQERFQPFEFQTNASMSDCIYAKSHCNEEGHIKNNDGTSKYDRTCRCDHKQNYAFIKIPRNPFFCKPAEEDCSCYIKSCPENYTLSKDYDCIQSSYQENTNSKDDNRRETVEGKQGVEMKENTNLKLERRSLTAITVTVSFCLCLITVIIVVAEFVFHVLNSENQ